MCSTLDDEGNGIHDLGRRAIVTSRSVRCNMIADAGTDSLIKTFVCFEREVESDAV